jgi:penicillin-binding protein-related factor A (putative recombinase)
MGKVNRGKDFESAVRKSFERISDVSIDRINDNMSGFKGVAGICDFIIYKYPFQLYLECKSCYGNTLNFHNITDNQWNGLKEKTDVFGVKAGVMIWFIDHDTTIYVPIQTLIEMKADGLKSFNINSDITRWAYKEIAGIKRRVLFDYEMLPFWWWLNNPAYYR